jgi:hypothetical protein
MGILLRISYLNGGGIIIIISTITSPCEQEPPVTKWFTKNFQENFLKYEGWGLGQDNYFLSHLNDDTTI